MNQHFGNKSASLSYFTHIVLHVITNFNKFIPLSCTSCQNLTFSHNFTYIVFISHIFIEIELDLWFNTRRTRDNQAETPTKWLWIGSKRWNYFLGLWDKTFWWKVVFGGGLARSIKKSSFYWLKREYLRGEKSKISGWLVVEREFNGVNGGERRWVMQFNALVPGYRWRTRRQHTSAASGPLMNQLFVRQR